MLRSMFRELGGPVAPVKRVSWAAPLVQVIPPVRWECPVCNSTLVDWPGLKHHVITCHIKRERYICTHCGSQCRSWAAMRNHCRQKHGPYIYRYVCGICGKIMTAKHTLFHHLRTMHGPERAWRCDLCRRGFVNEYQLEEHRKGHEGQRRYQCPHCPRQFVKRNTFWYHRQTHLKIYKCEGCGKIFKSVTGFKQHLARMHLQIVVVQ